MELAFERFGLSPKNIALRTPEGLLGWLPERLSNPARIYRLGIRICPVCFKLGYHFPIFQLLAYINCPEHGCELIPLSSLTGAADFPSIWSEVKVPSRAAWWPEGFARPQLNAEFPGIEIETRRIANARDRYVKAAPNLLPMFPLWPAELPAASLFEHSVDRDDYEALHREAFHLFVNLFATLNEADRPNYGQRLRVGTEEIRVNDALWAELAASEGEKSHAGPGGSSEDQSLDALVRRHPEARALESAVTLAARDFGAQFHLEHGACFHDKPAPKANSVPCHYCRTYQYWHELIGVGSANADGPFRWASGQALGRILNFLSARNSMPIAIQVTSLSYRALARVWNRALYFAVLAKVRRPDSADAALAPGGQYEWLKRALFARSIFPPTVLDFSHLPSVIRVHYLASIHEQAIPESDWDTVTRKQGAMS